MPVFINPDWANSAWYVGGSLGQSRAAIDEERLVRSLTANGAALTSLTTDERDLGVNLELIGQLPLTSACRCSAASVDNMCAPLRVSLATCWLA